LEKKYFHRMNNAFTFVPHDKTSYRSRGMGRLLDMDKNAASLVGNDIAGKAVHQPCRVG